MSWTDIEPVAALEPALFGGDRWSAASWWAELAQRPRREYVVARRDGELVGYAGLDHGGALADVMTLAVAPASQRQGVGERLLTELLRRAADRGATAVMLEVRADNAAALGLYRRHGFEQVAVRRRYYQPEGVDACVLIRRQP